MKLLLVAAAGMVVVAVSMLEAGPAGGLVAATPTPPPPAEPPPPCPHPTRTVTVPAGWSLVETDLTNLIANAVAPATIDTYTWDGMEYMHTAGPVVVHSAFTAGAWVNSPATVTVTDLHLCNPIPTFAFQLPANEWRIIANIATTPEQASGMDELWVYDQTTGYYQTDILQPGQGAWAISYQGGTITFRQVP